MIVTRRGIAGTGKVDVASTNPAEGEQCRSGKPRASKEDGLVGEQVAEQAHETCRTESANCREALVTAKAFRKSIISDQSKTDRSNCRTEESTSYAQEHLRDEHGRKARPKGQHEGGAGDRRDPKRDQRPLRLDRVEQFPRGYLD